MNILNALQYFALITGIMAILLGTVAMIFPTKMSEGFGIPTRNNTSGYVASLGARDVFVGLVVLMLYFNESWKMIAYTSFMISFVALIDFIVVLKKGNKKTSVAHLLGFLIFIVYGYFILP